MNGNRHTDMTQAGTARRYFTPVVLKLHQPECCLGALTQDGETETETETGAAGLRLPLVFSKSALQENQNQFYGPLAVLKSTDLRSEAVVIL